MMTTQHLSSQQALDFHLDAPRLLKQQELVEFYMASGQWRTLSELGSLIGNGNQAGVSARIRQLRKMGWTILKERTENKAVWRYRAVRRDN